MKRSIISTLLVFVVFGFIACGGDNSDDIAAAFEQDECEKNGNYWHTDRDGKNGECINNCDPNPCGHGSCKTTGISDHECYCDEGYVNNYNISERECMTPCEPTNPCGKGACIVIDYDSYKCKCDEGYFNYNDYSSGECVSPCEPINPCEKGTCIAIGYRSYTCDLCDPNPCGNGTCTSQYDNYHYTYSYECKCSDDAFFNGSQCVSMSEMVECDTRDITPCKDSSTNYIWSARSANAMRGGYAEKYCTELTEGGFSDWKLPSLDVLKTLCIGNQSKIGDTSTFWSSSYESSNKMYNVNFGQECSVESSHYDYTNINYHVRCVRW